VPVSTVQGWKQRDVFPDNRVEEIRAAAAADGIDLSALPAGEPDTASRVDATEPPGAASEPAETAPAPSPPAAPRDAGGRSLALVALVVAVVVAGWLLWNQLSPTSDRASTRIAALETELAGLRTARRDIADLRAALANLPARTDQAPFEDRIAALENRLAALAGRLDEAATATPDRVHLERIAADLEDLRVTATDNRAAVEALQAEIGAKVDDMPARLAAVEARRNELAATADVLSTRLAAVEGRGENRSAIEARSVGPAIAAAEVRQAVRGGAPFAADLATLRELAGDDAAIAPHLATLAENAADGVATPSELAHGFAARIGDILAAGRTADGARWYDRALARVASLVAVRRVGADIEGDSADAIVARAEARLDAGDLKGAVAEVEKLSGAAAEVVAPWRADARASIAAEAAVAAISAEALAALARAR
jgi:hypothetical protein